MYRIPSQFLLLLLSIFTFSCSSNPYAATNKAHKKQVKAYAESLRAVPPSTPGEEALPPGDYWVGTTNFSMRRPNYVIIHHTEQDSTGQTLMTFTKPATQVSAHYVIGKDGKVYHMLNDNLRAWHAGNSKWGNDTDLNSSSIGIELDNNGAEPFPEAQLNSLLQVLAMLKENYKIPDANFIGHADIAPVRKVDPSTYFPWKLLAERGFGLWYDEVVLNEYLLSRQNTVVPDTAMAPAPTPAALPDSLAAADTVAAPAYYPDTVNPQEALRLIGYDTRDMGAAIRAFKIHFIQKDTTPVLTEEDKVVLYNLYRKYL